MPPAQGAFWMERWGRYRVPVVAGNPRLWLHAASVGEVTGALATVFELRRRLPQAVLVLTVATPQGFRFARKQLHGWLDVFAAPLDLPWSVRAALNQFRPHLYVGFESEYWPFLAWSLRRRSIPAVLLNGRLSQRSARLYHKFPALFEPLFRYFACSAMISEADARNLEGFGVPQQRIRVLGSAKYDTLAARARLAPSENWRGLLRSDAAHAVVIGGSLRRRECCWLLDAFRALAAERPNLLGIFAPRHLHRIAEMARHLDAAGVGYHLLSRLLDGSERRWRSVVLVDRIGFLFELYALGDLIFCGGTLEPIGGHNIMEPAAWGKRVHYGPYVAKVAREHRLLVRWDASAMVPDAHELIRVWRDRLAAPEASWGDGSGPRQALLQLGGVAPVQAEILMEVLAAGRESAVGAMPDP